MPLRLPILAFQVVLAACTPPTPIDTGEPSEDTGDVDADEDSGVGEPFDECAPVLGEELAVRNLGMVSAWSRRYGADIGIWSTLEDFSAFWSSSGLLADREQPEVDFSAEQVVGVALLERGCFAHEFHRITGFHASTRDTADMVMALSSEAVSCDGLCDTEGSDTLYLWATPRRPMVTCEAGTRCP